MILTDCVCKTEENGNLHNYLFINNIFSEYKKEDHYFESNLHDLWILKKQLIPQKTTKIVIVKIKLIPVIYPFKQCKVKVKIKTSQNNCQN